MNVSVKNYGKNAEKGPGRSWVIMEEQEFSRWDWLWKGRVSTWE